MPARSAACCRCCSRSPAGMTASWSAAAPIFSRCMPMARPRLDRTGRAGAITGAEPNSLAGEHLAGPGASGVSPRRQTPREAAGTRVQMQFEDNALLPQLFGERDRHLDRIERQLGVSLVSRGNRLAIGGPRAGADRRASRCCNRALRAAEARARSRSRPVDAALRLAEHSAATRGRAAERTRFDPHPQAPHRAAQPQSGAPISRRCATRSWCSAWGPPAPARPISRSPWRSTC